LIAQCLREKQSKIEAIAYTAGPGLAGSLLIGSHVARTLSLALNLPLLPIHHLEGHFLAAVIEHGDLWAKGPVLILIISGGHTQLVYSPVRYQYIILGKTLDDAAGEAFDKIAKYLGLGYPGGARLSALAEKKSKPIEPILSLPMKHATSLDFSFSGLKTQATTINYEKYGLQLEDFCATVEYTISAALVLKTKKALERYPLVCSLIVCGGVASNQVIRRDLKKMAHEFSCEIYFPSPHLCTDNGAMIAAAGLYHWKHKGPALLRSAGVYPRWCLEGEPLSDS
jgi:N6-L-threonylcarbamoyladenine synthase